MQQKIIPQLKKPILPNLEKLPKKKVTTKPQNQKIRKVYPQRPHPLEMQRPILRESSLLLRERLERTAAMKLLPNL